METIMKVKIAAGDGELSALVWLPNL